MWAIASNQCAMPIQSLRIGIPTLAANKVALLETRAIQQERVKTVAAAETEMAELPELMKYPLICTSVLLNKFTPFSYRRREKRKFKNLMNISPQQFFKAIMVAVMLLDA
jgi:hypothetical protein